MIANVDMEKLEIVYQRAKKINADLNQAEDNMRYYRESYAKIMDELQAFFESEEELESFLNTRESIERKQRRRA